MPRALRIETNDGLFHVINRGNYRSEIFETAGAKQSFEKCLFEACERFGWDLLGYCLLSNHFHLCIATPRGNLSEGMRWLQSTYAARFNRFRKEGGHLFQGRFKSLIVEPGEHLCGLLAYIHLNPVRAGIVEASAIAKFRWSSLYWFPKKRSRPKFMDSSWLDYLDRISDSTAGWRKYSILLQLRTSEDPKEIVALEKRMSRGWCIGHREFKKLHAKEFFEKKETLRLAKEGLADLNESHWESVLEKCLNTLSETEESAGSATRSVDWKLLIASKMKSGTSVRNRWLSERLDMVVPRAVSSYCSVYSKGKDKCLYYRKLKNITFDV